MNIKKSVLLILFIIFISFTLFLLAMFFDIQFFQNSKGGTKIKLKEVGWGYWGSAGITDKHSGSFKEFILRNNTANLLKDLYKGLDEESIKNIEISLHSILHVPDKKYKKYSNFDAKKFEEDFLDPEAKKSRDEFLKSIPKIKKQYKLPRNAVVVYGVFYDHHNLRFANQKIKDYIKDKIFIDAGAYIGDSVLVLLKYQPSIIYSFDISEINFKRYNKTMELNNVPKEKYELIKLAIADKKSSYEISSYDSLQGINDKDKHKDAIVYSTDLDSFMKDKQGKVGFIKADLQGRNNQKG